MKKYILFMVMLSIVGNLYSQRRKIDLHQSDPRFTIWAEAYYNSVNDENLFYYVQNNTNEKYELEVEVTVNSTCHPSRTSQLGLNRVVFLNPNALFTPSDDWVHSLLGKSDAKECRRKLDKDTYTFISSISYRYVSIRNLTMEEKLKAEEKAKKEALELEQKKQKEADALAKKEKELEEAEELKKKKEEEAIIALELSERKLREEEQARKLEEAQKQEEDNKGKRTEEQQREEDLTRKQEDAKNEKIAKEQKELEANERERLRNEEERIRKEQEMQREEEEDKKKPYCLTRSAMFTAREIKGAYDRIVGNYPDRPRREEVMNRARDFLFLCPYDPIVTNVLQELQAREDAELALMSLIMDNASSTETEVMRSIVENTDDNTQNGVFKEFGLMLKFHYGIPEIAFVAGFGLSFVKFPKYTFNYNNTQYILSNSYPEENVPTDMEGAIEIDVGLGLRGQIPIIKSGIKGDHAKLGLVLETLAILSYSLPGSDLKSYFPEILPTIPFKLRGTAGLSLKLGESTLMKVALGMEKNFLNTETSGYISGAENNSIPVDIRYNAEITNFNSMVPYASLSFVF